MIKTLMGSIRDYMKVTVATPLLVLGQDFGKRPRLEVEVHA